MRLLDHTFPLSDSVSRDIHEDLKFALEHLQMNAEAQDKYFMCVSELVSNAMRHGDAQPNSFRIQLSHHADVLHLCIMDDGSAFEDLENFYKVSETRAENVMAGELEVGGLGLFLASRDFDTFVYEREGQWNIYSFSEASPLAQKKPRVLIIDDAALDSSLHEAFICNDYDVIKASSGKEGLSLLESMQDKPDLILSDVVMADGDGVEFCRAVQKQRDLALIPFLFITGKPENKTSQLAEDLPVNDVLHKPVQKDELLRIIRRVLKKAALDQRLMGQRLDEDVTQALAPSLPSRIGPYNIELKWRAVEAGGGDMAFHLPGQGCDHILVIDVMGHGAQAKIFSHSFAGYVQGFLSAQGNVTEPGEILGALSRFLYADIIGQKTIITAQALTIYEGGKIKMASAGHPAPYVVHSNDAQALCFEGGIPGLDEREIYESLTVDVPEDTSLYIYTDGLMEVGEGPDKMLSHEQNVVQEMAAQPSAESLWGSSFGDVIPADDALLIRVYRD